MRTHLLLKGTLVFIFTLFTVSKMEARALSDLNEGEMQGIFQDLSIFPNPVEDKLFIHYTLLFDTEVAIEIFNALGQKVTEYSASAVRQQAGTYQLIISRPEVMDSGLYFIRLTVPGTGSLTQTVMAR